MRIYLASNWGSKERIKEIKRVIELMPGHTVCSGWLEEDNGQNFESLTDAQRQEYSYRDLGEIVSADLLIIDTMEPSPSGGREIEMGFAMGRGTAVWTVGPDRNIFHSVASLKFSSWNECLDYLRGYSR